MGAGSDGGRGGNLKNMVIAFLVPLPSIFFYLTFVRPQDDQSGSPSPVTSWCAAHPLLLANVLFLFNVNVLFWFIGLLLNNNWLIDLYWTVIPVMLLHYFRDHPAAVANAVRSAVVVALTWVWSIRLTHNYLRREGWVLGKQEDWRFSDLRKQYGKTWWWMSFFAVYVSQQIFLIGICLPMYAVHSSDQPLGIWDLVATIACIAGVVIAYFADTQLHEFVTSNEKLKHLGEPTVPTLEDGMWGYSRHPNYFGEQLWWWGLYLFAWNLGQQWMFIGALVNSMCLGYVTVLVERRMLKQEHRAEAYKLYQKRTSVLIPWFRKANQAIPEPKQKET